MKKTHASWPVFALPIIASACAALLMGLSLSSPTAASTGKYVSHAPSALLQASRPLTGTDTPTSTPRMSSTVIQLTPTRTGTSSATAFASTTPTCVKVNPTWTAEATVPAPGRYNAAGVTASDGKFYVVGGLDSNSAPVANTDAFNPATNFWDSLAPLAQARGNPAIGHIDNLVFVTGGNLTGNTLSAANDIYNTTTNVWTPSTDAPQPFTGASGWGSEATGRYYVFGGNTGPTTVSTQTLIFNPHTATWQNGAPMPGPKTFGVSAGWGGRIYIFGGADATDLSASLFEYNPVADTWAVKSPGPRPRFKPGMSARNGKLFVTGGGLNPSNPYEPSGSVDVYDIAGDTWTTTTNMLYSRVGQVQGTLNDGRLIVATGIITTSFRTRTTETLPPSDPCVPVGTPSPTASATASATSTPTTALTASPSRTATGAVTVSATPTLCPITFSDVPADAWFYEFVRCLYCRGAISGYGDNTFRPYNNTTRGQMAKIVVVGFNIPVATPTGASTFRDVAPDNAFYPFVESAASNSLISGYACGGPSEPCPGLYYRPNANVTRGQLSKIVVGAGVRVYSWQLIDPTSTTFLDVERGSAFYGYIETAVCHGIISGYSCGGAGEPCPGLYFRSGANATRAQISKIVCGAVQNAVQCGP